MNARASSQLLYFLARLNPAIYDVIFPHGPRISAASREYLIAMAIKGFSAELGDSAIAKKLAGVQRALVQHTAQNIASDYDGDDWCPTRPRPIPHPIPEPWAAIDYVALNPQPLPPKDLKREIGGYLLMLSEATSVGSAAKELQGIGKSLAGQK
jgi:hypothetical protein